MTREEAIDVLSDFRKFTLSILGKSIYAERCSALDMAIEALSADTIPIEKYHELQHDFVMLGATFADLNEVVRCKVCKYYDSDGSCDKNSGFCVNHDHDMDDDDFCSWGERKHE